MSDFSSSGIADLPGVTADTILRGDARVLGFCKEAEQEGDRLNADDPSYEKIERAQRYVTGDQRQRVDKAVPSYLPKVVLNESRKVVQAHVSALTDLKPLFKYVSENPAFQFHADLLNKRIVAWWVTQMIDVALGETIKYGIVGGTGDLGVEWDPSAGLGGENVCLPRDPRDTLALRPSNQRDPQLWQGVTLRDGLPINALRAKYPTYEHLFAHPSSDSTLSRLKGRFRSVVSALQRPVGDTLSGLNDPVKAGPRFSAGSVVLRRTYLADLTKNLTTNPIAMGPTGTNWSYVVPPGGFLYPRKRLIVWTDEGIISDGPNPYWHGLYPIARLLLWSVPWQFLGISLLNDTMPIQDAINDTAQDLRIGLEKWMAPSVAFDRAAVSEAFMKTYDPRRKNTRIKLNAGFGEGFRHLDGPNPRVLMLGLQFLDRLIAKHEDLSSVANLEAIIQLRQMPGADTIQAFMQALTPQIRSEARQIESFLRRPAEMVKSNLFQFESQAKRFQVLGEAGVAMDEFDYDPDTVIPAMSPGDDNYIEELDRKYPRDRRARFFTKQLVFVVAPNSLIALNAQQKKLTDLQLARMGFLDFWTLAESMEIGNVGTPPPIPLPPLTQPSPEELQAGLMIPGAPNTGDGKYIIDPESGQLLEIRVPLTVTERLLAQAKLGIGMTINPAGRKAAGDAPPRIQTKDGGTRPTVTESRR